METRPIEAAREALLWTNWRLQLTIPSVLAAGEEFRLRITAFGPDAMPSGDFGREIFFEESPGVEGLAASVRLTPSGGGHIEIHGLRAVGPEHAFVVARPKGCPGPVFSNPAWVLDDPPYRVYWGDIHVHTTYSNCFPWACKDPEFCYAYAREAAHLDFAAAADHLRGIAAEEHRWGRLRELVRLYDSPGSLARRQAGFVPFLAFESSHKTGFGGDINAYFLGHDAPHFWLDREDMRGVAPEVPLRELWDFLDSTGKDYLTIPHHTGRAGKYRSFADPVYDRGREPLFEIFSAWGSSECRWNRFPLHAGNTDEPAYFRDALLAGCRYGVIASSDDHCTLPGGEAKNWGEPAGPKCLAGYVQRGLAAVRAPKLSREALWKALVSRNCYGTTFARTLLDFSIGDIGMGQEAPVGKRDPLRKRREVRVRALKSRPGPLSVVLIRNDQEIARERWNPARPEIVFTDETDLEGVAVRNARFHPEPFVVYYVRLQDRTDQTQWSSPIWLDLEA